MDRINRQIPCISLTDAIGTAVTNAFLIVKRSDSLHQSVIIRFWKLARILKLRGSTSSEHSIMKISKNQSPIIWVYTMLISEDEPRCSDISISSMMMSKLEVRTSTRYTQVLC
jgi:hypothetical protein